MRFFKYSFGGPRLLGLQVVLHSIPKSAHCRHGGGDGCPITEGPGCDASIWNSRSHLTFLERQASQLLIFFEVGANGFVFLRPYGYTSCNGEEKRSLH